MKKMIALAVLLSFVAANLGLAADKKQPAKENKAAEQLKKVENVKPKDSAKAREGFDTKVKDKGEVKVEKVTKQDPVKIARDESAKERAREKGLKTKPVPSPKK